MISSTSVIDSRTGPAAQRFLTSQPGLLIDGELVPAASGKTLVAENPATGTELMRVPAAGPADVDTAVRAARRALKGGWCDVTPRTRGELLWRLADLIEEHAEELAELECLDNGKPLLMAQGDMTTAVEQYRYMAGWATKLTGDLLPVSAPGEFLAYTVREPVGVVGQIIPWNFPMVSAAWKLAPALAAGCTVVLKPAEQTPVTALRLAQLVIEAGFPAGVVNILTGYGSEAGSALVNHPDVDKIAFTGSTATGQLIARQVADGVKRLTLELGGKSPVIVLPDADIDRVVARASAGIFYNQGQVCSAGSRMYVHRSIVDTVIERISDAASQIVVAPGLDPASQMGPLVSRDQLNRVAGYVRQGIDGGAEVVAGGARHGEDGYFYRPTVLLEDRHDSVIAREEIFGPVLVASSFTSNDLDDIVRMANSTEYGLAASVFTRDGSTAQRLARRIKAGTVWINTHHVYDAALPFGGFKKSGYGRELGRDAIDAYTETKTVTTEL